VRWGVGVEGRMRLGGAMNRGLAPICSEEEDWNHTTVVEG
jgi:hypothetical protein